MVNSASHSAYCQYLFMDVGESVVIVTPKDKLIGDYSQRLVQIIDQDITKKAPSPMGEGLGVRLGVRSSPSSTSTFMLKSKLS